MPIPKFLTRILGKQTMVDVGVNASAGAGDADKAVVTDSTGKIDLTFFPTGIGPDIKIIVASEALNAGDWVNVYDNAGTVSVRKTDASSPAKEVNGFVLANVASSANATVYFEGTNNQLSGLTKGVEYYLSTTPGTGVVAASISTTSGHIGQLIGKAISTTEITFEPGETWGI